MGTARRHAKVKLIAGLISHETDLLDNIKKVLERSLNNKIDFESGLTDFVHTDYYREEMGGALKRKFLSFARSVPLKDVEKVKLVTNRIEKKFSVNGKRRVNIDPGYLDLSKLVLFSTKDYSHRIHIGRGIFAEVTLYYEKRKFKEWPWTYPDYKTDEYKSVFGEIRDIHKREFARARVKKYVI